MSLMGQYCLEGDTNCILMSISWLIAALESLFLLARILTYFKKSFTAATISNASAAAAGNNPVSGDQSTPLPTCVHPLTSSAAASQLFLSIPHTILNILAIGIAAALVYTWLTNDDESSQERSPMLLQAFVLNILSALIWLVTMIKFNNASLSLYSQCSTSMTVNLLMNTFFAIISASDKTTMQFYLYIAYTTIICLHITYLQVVLRRNVEYSLSDEAASTMNTQPSTRVESKSTGLFLSPKIKAAEDIDNLDDSESTVLLTAPLITVDKLYSHQSSNISNASTARTHSQSNPNIDEGSYLAPSRISQVRIDRFLETIKYSKKTIVYEVKYLLEGHPCVIRRSFREFSSLNSMIKSKYASKSVIFPQKKHQSSILSSSDLEQRRLQLQSFLQSVAVFIEIEDMRPFFDDRCDQQQEKMQQYMLQQQQLIQQQQQSQQLLLQQQQQQLQQQQQNNNQYKTRSHSNNYPPSFSSQVPETIWEDEAEHLALSSTS